MPELPEVQTLINTLKKKDIFNSSINSVKVIKPKLLKNCDSLSLNKFLLGEKIVDIERIGKYLIFNLTKNKILCIHLRMEGKIIIDSFKNPTTINNKHMMLQLNFSNQNQLKYFDARMFGTLHIYNSKKEMLSSKEIGKIGIDPFNKNFKSSYLSNKFFTKKQAIKTTLLDQTIIAGIGNIYANEILFLSRINPKKSSNKINMDEIQKIIINTKKILAKAIKFNGTTISSFTFDEKHMGEFQKFLQVHSKLICPACKKTLKKEKINGRGTYYCPFCQK